MTLRERLADGSGIDELGGWLDGLSHDERWAALAGTTRADQRALFERAAVAIEPAQFIPVDVPDLAEVVHLGRNTLPLPRPCRFFEKRMARNEGQLFGYNEGAFRGLIGPGYFVVRPSSGEPAWEPLGAQLVDYCSVPTCAVPDGWPRVVPNSHGLQIFVYHSTHDIMRRVSAAVSIGSAYKWALRLDHYFVLCRVE